MAFVDDGTVTFSGGQNDGLSPDNIGLDQYRRAINVTTKNGNLGPRPAFIHKEITVVTEGRVSELSYSKIFHSGKFQAATSYDSDDGKFIIAVISGIIFRIDPQRLEAEVIQIGEDSEDRMSQYRRRIHWSYAGKFLVFYDYPNLPVIIENREARRVDTERESFPGVPLPEIPTSVLGVYAQNRLWVANEVNEFTAGDPVGGINEDAPITFEETLTIGGAYYGQVFSLGNQPTAQPITALGFLQVPDTSTGVGPILVATKNSIYAYRGDLPRSQWEQTAFGRLLLYNAGIVGPRAFTNLNSDIIFLSNDGQVRSLQLNSGDQQRWDNAPISREVEPWLNEFSDKALLDIAFVNSYGGRIFISVAPYRTQALSLDKQPVKDYAHGGMVVLELDNVSALGANAQPAWAGLWTGISPMEMVVMEEGPYIFAKDDGGINRLYFMDESATQDEFQGEKVDIICRVYTREYDFQSRFQDKKTGSIDYSLSDIEGDFRFHAEYRSSAANNWSTWRSFFHQAKTEFCEETANECLPILAPHGFREMDFGDPDEVECDILTNERSDIIKKVGLRLTISAKKWRLENLHLRYEILEETTRPATQRCENIENKELQFECENNDWELHRTSLRNAEWPLQISTPW